MIPKIIHYCWFGGKEKPELVKKCINSWMKYFPDFEIKEWNENNFDINCNTYVQQAYTAKKYAFVADYVRFWALEREGGLYFDTDVEVIRSFGDLLNNEAFVGFENKEYVNPGQVLYLKKENNIIFKEIKEWYDNATFLDENGEMIPHTVCTVFTELLKKYGFQPNGKKQVCNGMVLYPVDYFNPYDDATGRLHKTENTYAIHWYAKSWIPKGKRFRSKITRVFHRVFGKDCFKKFKKKGD